MSMDNEQPTTNPQPTETDATPTKVGPLIAGSIAKALEVARDRLVDRSLRNKLINTPLQSSKARQIRSFDELSDQVFRHLRSKQVFTFLPGRVATGESEDAGDDDVWVPPLEGDPSRHNDNKLQTKLTPEGLQKRLLSLFYEGQTLEEEQGVNVLFLALGFLEWREDKNSEIQRFAPLVLLPVDLVRDGANDRFKLRVRDEDLFTNISLQAWLKDQFRMELPDIPETDEWQPSSYFDEVSKVVAGRKGWQVHPNEILLGFFSFSKFLLWRDLRPENWGSLSAQLLENPLLRNLLLRHDDDGDLVDIPLISDEERIDEVFKPIELIHVTDADSSQAIAIQEVMAGKNLVIQGPPGTGKSQTITNIIAGATQRGKRVLFIAEKMAALNVVHDRLKQKGLEPICLELHSRKSSKSQVIDQIKRGQTAASPPKWSELAFEELTETQKRLREHSDRLHRSEPGELSPFDVIGKICLLKSQGVPTPDFKYPPNTTWTENELKKLSREALQVAERIVTSGTPSLHPWKGVGINSPDILTRDRVRPLVDRCSAEAKALVDVVSIIGTALQFNADPTIHQIYSWIHALGIIAARPVAFDKLIQQPQILERIEDLESVVQIGLKFTQAHQVAVESFRPEAFNEEWAVTRKALATHGSSFFRVFSTEYRVAVAALRGVWKGDLPKDRRERLEKLEALIDQQRLSLELNILGEGIRGLLGSHWEGPKSDWYSIESLIKWLRQAKLVDNDLSVVTAVRLIDPYIASSYGKQLATLVKSALQSFEEVRRSLDVDWVLAFGTSDITSIAASLLEITAVQWSKTFELIADWPPARDGLGWLRSIGAEDLADRIYDGRISANLLEPSLMLSMHEVLWANLQKKNANLARVLGDELHRLVDRFRKADLDRIRLASDQTRRSHLDRHPTGTSGAAGILADEMKKSRNLMPVRKLMLKAGEAIQKFTPVFLMSPLSVAQYLQPGALEFDLLVIDEASQVRPEDALGAIVRCKQLVVVGDDRQLPPTNFFNKVINDDELDEDDDPDAAGNTVRTAIVKDVESILNLCSRFPTRMLKWHYRSEHPALIATSNRNFYGGELMLPPSVVAGTSDGKTGLLFQIVPDGGYERGKTARNEIEAGLIAKAALKHAQETPKLSLGIGTFSVAQRDCVRDCIDDLARMNPELDAFIKGEGGRETLFVKNLENIQGDERDVIFISVGYGRDANGKLTQNFGPVGREGGERRLNVLITRARKRCEVFSSIVAEDIRIEGVGKPGVTALKEFLKLAKDGYSAVATITSRGFDSPFEEAVAASIKGLGYEVMPQVGMAGFFIDLAVIDPRDKGRYILGVECDGASYHSSRYARDRDRLRQAILESRGWHIHRIWSTDWFYKPEREISKLRQAIESAINTAANTSPEVEPAAVIVVNDPITSPPLVQGGAKSEPPNGLTKGLPPYQIANFRVPRSPILPQELSDSDLVQWTTKIVEIEQPIHVEEVARRLATCCGKQRAGNQILIATKKGLNSAKRMSLLNVENDFWTLSTPVTTTARDRSNLESSENVRKPAMIAPSEFEVAAFFALQQNLALEDEELLVETAKLLGFARIGPDVRAAIKKVLKERVEPKVQRDHLGRMRSANN